MVDKHNDDSQEKDFYILQITTELHHKILDFFLNTKKMLRRMSSKIVSRKGEILVLLARKPTRNLPKCLPNTAAFAEHKNYLKYMREE